MPVLAPVAEPKSRTELDRLQGSWTSIAGPGEARLLVAGNRFTVEFDGGDIFMGTLDLDPGKSGQMDMRIDAGPGEHQGQVALCIYHLEGGVLRWCPGRPGSGRRLTAFPSVDDRRYLSFVFRQSKKRAPRA